MPDPILDQSAPLDSLAAAIQDHVNDHLEGDEAAVDPAAHKYGANYGAAFPAGILSLAVAESAAKFVQDILVDNLGGAAHAVVAAEHDAIAQWVAPKMAELIASLVGEFGDAK